METILEAIKAKAILARQAGKNGVDLGENLPAFLASLSVGGRINKDDLVAWLKSINSFILAYVQDRKPSADEASQKAMVAKLVDWASKTAAPNPNWSDPQWESLDRLASFLADLAAVAQPEEFPNPAMLDS